MNENSPYKNFVVVQGNPKDLDISPVKDNLAIETPKTVLKPQDIIIPENQKKYGISDESL